MPVRGLTIVVTSPAPFRAALELAAANAALGGRARLFLQGDAVAALADLRHLRDDAHAAAGLPTLADLFEEALALGIEIVACQTGLALADIAADTLDRRILFGGAVGILSSLETDRLALI